MQRTLRASSKIQFFAAPEHGWPDTLLLTIGVTLSAVRLWFATGSTCDQLICRWLFTVASSTAVAAAIGI
jgi:hypothetical protein